VARRDIFVIDLHRHRWLIFYDLLRRLSDQPLVREDGSLSFAKLQTG
jgi:hypothetical protein